MLHKQGYLKAMTLFRGLYRVSAIGDKLETTFATIKRTTAAVMQVEKRSNHMDRTADNTRHQTISPATVTDVRDESKTVKTLALQIHNPRLSFKAGQWLDMFIPGVDTVGGYSMCSSPIKLAATGQLDLAVKFSKHPPAYWVHTQCKVGCEVHIRTGGDFFFDPASQSGHDLLLIAGGVGINPLYSILNHVNELQMQGDNSSSTPSTGRVMLLYSSSTLDELIFRDRLDEIQKTNSRIRCQYHITREETSNNSDTAYTGSRILAKNISQCFDWLNKDATLAYICGPLSMLTDMEQILLNEGLGKDSIKYEKWW